MVDFLGEDDELLRITDTRVPVCLCLDISGSMNLITNEEGMRFTGETGYIEGQLVNFVEGGTTRLNELNEGIRAFYNALREDETAMNACEVGVVTFNDRARVLQDFKLVGDGEIPQIEGAAGDTNLDAGVMMAVELLESRKAQYKQAGRSYYQPWLVIMTDGAATTDSSRSQAKVKALEASGKLTVFMFAIGDSTDENENRQMQAVLQGYSNKRPPLRIKEGSFAKFFEWLSASVGVTSRSKPGEKTTLPKPTDDFFDSIIK